MPSHLIDQAILAQLEADTGQEALLGLIETYIEETKARLVRMSEQQAQFDFATLGREAHSLKSASKTFGALPLGVLAAELERSVAERRSETAARLMKQIPAIGRATLAALNEILAAKRA